MNNYANYMIRGILILLGVFLAIASKVMFPIEFNNFWRLLIEIGGYVLIATGCGVFGVLCKPKE